MEKEPIDTREQVSVTEFLLRLKKQFSIKSIFYPASGRHKILSTAFAPHEIVLLDNDGLKTREEAEDKNRKGRSGLCSLMDGEPFVLANYDLSPFKVEVFDAIFYNCNYAQEEGSKEIFRTLKVGGIVILGSIGWNGFYDEDIERFEDVGLPFVNTEPPNPFEVGIKVR